MGTRKSMVMAILTVILMTFGSIAMAEDYKAVTVGNYENVTVMEFTGNYDTPTTDDPADAIPRQVIANEFHKTHKDDYDFLVIFSNFDFQMPQTIIAGKLYTAGGFYHSVKNDTAGIGDTIFDNASLYGSQGKLQGTIDMGFTGKNVMDPLDPLFEQTMTVLSHELLHRWSAYVKFKKWDGSISNDLLGSADAHWSFLLDTKGSMQYGNPWIDNGNGTFTSLPGRKYYSALDLYLMGMIPKDQVPPMLLIENPDINKEEVPQAGITIIGTPHYVTIDDIIAAEGERTPDAAHSQKNFKIGCIYITRPGTFESKNELYPLRTVLKNWTVWFSSLTKGKAMIKIDVAPEETIPVNPGVIIPPYDPRTAPPSVQDALTWLLQNQQPDGSWQDSLQTIEKDTTESVLTLTRFPEADPNTEAGLDWLSGTTRMNTDYLARKIEVFSKAKENVSELLADLLARRNTDGGWGGNLTFISNPADTAWALRALAMVESKDESIIQPAIAFLLQNQNANGGWDRSGNVSTIQTTVNVLFAFIRFQDKYPLSEAIQKGLAWLFSKQNEDGGFGNSPSTVYDTALALALLKNFPVATDMTDRALGYILSFQNENGSWYASPYQTALALNVLSLWIDSTQFDLAITGEDISFDPPSIISLQQESIIRAEIKNIGLIPVPQVTIALYDGDLTASNKVDEKTIAVAGKSSTLVDFKVSILDGKEHTYFVVIDPDHLLAESNRTNNAAEKGLKPAPDLYPDLIITDDHITLTPSTVTVLPQDVEIKAVIENRGRSNVPAVKVVVYDGEVSSGNKIGEQTLAVPGKSSAFVVFNVNIGDEKAHQYYFSIDPENLVFELDESNNSAVKILYNTASIDPDLSIRAADISFEPSEISVLPTEVTIQAVIWNYGMTGVTAAKVALYDGPVNEANKIGENEMAFPSRASVTAIFKTTLIIGKEYRFNLVIDPDNQVKEIFKTNNTAFKTLSLRTTYDLEVSSSALSVTPSRAEIGQLVTIKSKIGNRGTADAFNVPVRYFITKDGRERNIAALYINVPAGRTVAQEIPWTADQIGENQKLQVQADPNNQINELSETNNAAEANLTIMPVQKPNLVIVPQDIIFPPDPINAASDLAISARIRNTGPAGATGVKVVFYKGDPAIDGVLLYEGLLDIDPQSEKSISFVWPNIGPAGKQVIFVKVDPENVISELDENDNNALRILTILGLPDLTVFSGSIEFDPAMPKDGAPLNIVAGVRNEGEQYVPVVWVHAYEGTTLIGKVEARFTFGNALARVSFSYDTTGKEGAHEVQITVDPENTIRETNESNNSAGRSFAVQDADQWVTEKYFSPNGDSVKDSTQFFFALKNRQTVSVQVVDSKNQPVRKFSGPDLENILGGSVVWNGLNAQGAVVTDGPYQFQVVSGQGPVLSATPVIVDNNRSLLRNAIGTSALLQGNLTCELPNISQREWFPDESGLVLCVQDKLESGGGPALRQAKSALKSASGNPSAYPGGLYTIGPNGDDIFRLVPEEWESYYGTTYIYGNRKTNFVLSPDGEKIAFALTIYRWGYPEEVELWVVDRYGQKLTLLDSYSFGGARFALRETEDGDGNNENDLIKEIHWSADGNYLSYITDFYTCYGESCDYNCLRSIKTDGSEKECYDFNASFFRWSPTENVFVYANDSGIYLAEINGQAQFVLGISGSLEYMQWLDDQKVIAKSFDSLWLLDVKGQNAAIKLAETEPFPDSGKYIAVNPETKQFAFIKTQTQSDPFYSLNVCDAKGVCSTLHQSSTQMRDVAWSRNGSKLAVFDKIVPERESAPRIYQGSLMVADPITGMKKFYETGYHIGAEDGTGDSEDSGDSSEYPYDSSSLEWLGDNTSLVTRDIRLFIFDTEEQKKIYLPTGEIHADTDVRVSPQGRYITYDQKADPNGVCSSSGDRDIWSLSSLLNLTADLIVKKDRSAVILKGTATDLNFAYYTLEYAAKKDPGKWQWIVPYANIPVLNDLFTSWVPPFEGTFFIRLTVYDLAGNRYSAQKQITWGRSSSIINLRKVNEIFSPILQDPARNTAELHYRVLEPVSLVFYVYDQDDQLLKTLYKNHATVPVGGLDDFVVWDGSDAANVVVPDGPYKIKIFDYEFFCKVDTLAPVAKLELRPPEVPFVPKESKEEQKCFESYYADLFGLALDKHLKEWTVEYGAGDNPQDWNPFLAGNGAMAATDAQGYLLKDKDGNILPTLLKTLQENEVELAVGKKFRITGEDRAGNKSTAVTDYLEEVLLLEQYTAQLGEETKIYHFRIKRDEAGRYVTHDGAIGRDHYIYKLIRSLDGIETIRSPLTQINLQYRIASLGGGPGEEWRDGAPVFNPGSGRVSLTPDVSSPLYMQASAVRIKAVDETGKEYYSNAVSLDGEPPIIIAPPGGSGSAPDYPEALDCRTLSVSQERLPMTLTLSGVTTYRSEFCYLYAERDSTDFKPLACFNVLPGKDIYNFQIPVSQVPEGLYQLKGVLKFSQELKDQEIPIKTLMIIDRTLPEALITYPDDAIKICPTRRKEAGKERLEIAIEGIARDETKFKYWELHYGIGREPSQWSLALDPQGRPIKGQAEVQGQIGIWNVTDFSGDVALRLKVVDYAGNVNCYVTHFSIDTEISLKASVERTLFSPNDDGKYDDVRIHYALEEYGQVGVSVYKQLADQSYELIRQLQEDKACDICTEEIIWDGKDDNGQVKDGNYRIVVNATDVCENKISKNFDVEIDITPPKVEIVYPQPGDTLGMVIEVKGTATDLNFNYYKLRIANVADPGAETLINEAQNPLLNQILGKWNRFNQEGAWILKLKAEDKVANDGETTVTIYLGEKQNLIVDLDAAPKLFSPNRDGKLEETIFEYSLNSALNEKFDTTLEFYSGGNLLKSVKELSVAGGPHAYVWDGDIDGAIAPDGPYAVILIAALSANPTISQREKVTVIVDKTAPVIEIMEPSDRSYVKNNPVPFKGSITDANISAYGLQLNGPQGIVPVAAGKQNRVQYDFANLNDLPEEIYTLTVRAEDLGLIVTEKNLSFTVDRTPPKVTISAPKEGELFGGNKSVASITGRIEEKNPKSWILRYGAGDNPDQWTILAQGEGLPDSEKIVDWKVGKNDHIPDGWYTIALYALDKAGWEAETRIKIYVDNTPPTVAISAPAGYVTKPQSIKGTVSDQHLEEYVLEMAGGDCGSAFQWVLLETGKQAVENGQLGTLKFVPPDGKHCLRLSAKDRVGNQAQTVSAIIVDTVPPGPPVLFGKLLNKRDGDLFWTHEQESDFAGYNLYRDGKKINAQLIPERNYLDRQLDEGLYAYVVKAVDQAGLESRASNEVKLKVSLSPPKAKIFSPRDGAVVSGLADIKGMAFSDDDFKEYRVFIGEGSLPEAWMLIKSSPVPIAYGLLVQWDTLGLPENSLYSIKLEAEDLAGNTALDQVVVRIDNQFDSKPILDKAVVIGSGLNDVDLAWHLDPETPPDLAGYLLYRNEQLANVPGTVIGNLKPYLIENPVYLDQTLPDGTYSYYVVAMDEAGNLSEQSNPRTVIIESGPPKAVIIVPQNGHRFMDTLFIQAESKDQDIASIQFQYQKTGTGTWIKLNSPVTSRPYVTYLDPVKLNLTYGDYRLNAVATDLSVQSDPDPEDIGIVYIDTIAPQAPINLRTLTDGGKVTLTWDHEAEKDLSGYNIYRILSDSKEKLNLEIVSGSTTYIHLGPQGAPLDDDEYAYEVRALDIYGNESKPSNQADAVVYTPLIEQLYTPSGVSNVAVSGNNVKPDDRVDIYISGTSNVGQPQMNLTADKQGQFGFNTTLNLGENWLWTKAADAAGNKSKISEPMVVVFNEPPATPTGFKAVMQGQNVNATWNPNTEADLEGYNLFREEEKINASSAMLSGTATASENEYAAAWAFDQNPAYGWYCYFYKETKSQWWQLQFPSSRLIRGVEIEWYSPYYGGGDYEIQVWSGYAWITRKKVIGNQEKINSFEFDPSYRTDKIRIFITKPVTETEYGIEVNLAEVRIRQDNVLTAETYQDSLSKLKQIYKLTAVDYYGFESPPTEGVPAGDVTPPDPPLHLKARADYADIILDWTAGTMTDLAGYNVYRKTPDSWIKINPSLVSGTTTYTDHDLPNGTYTYRVTAMDTADNESAPSNEDSASINIQVPGEPINLTVEVAPVGKALKVCWEYKGGPVAGYNLYRALAPGGPYVPVNRELIEDTCYLDTDLKDGIKYYYIVFAVDQYGNEGIQSNEDFGIPWDIIPPDPPVLFHPTINGIPLNVDKKKQDIGGWAEPDALVELFKNGKSITKTKAYLENRNRTVSLCEHTGEVSLSPDAKALAYHCYDENNKQGVIWIKDLASGNAVKVAENDQKEQELKWSPDSQRIIFSYPQHGYEHIGIYDCTTGFTTPLTNDAYTYERNPIWSHDGYRMAFVSNRDGYANIWIKDFVSGSLFQATHLADAQDASEPRFSPDDSKLAYIFRNDNSYSLAVLSLDSGVSTTIPGSYVTSFDWSPSGKTLAYVSRENAVNDVYIYDIGSGQKVQITNSVLSGQNIRKTIWSPYEHYLSFIADDNSGSGLWGARVKQWTQPNLLKKTGEKPFAFIAWLVSGEIAYKENAAFHQGYPDGYFTARDVDLSVGDNFFHVTAADADGNVSPPSESIDLIYDPLAVLPDLEVQPNDITIYPGNPILGDNAQIYVQVHNKGAVAARNVEASIYLLNSHNEGELVYYGIIPFMAENSEQNIFCTWNSGQHAGDNNVIAVVDPYNRIMEISENNNIAERLFYVAEHEGVEMRTILNAEQYQVNEEVRINIDIHNSGSLLAGALEVRIEDENNAMIYAFNSIPVTLSYGESRSLDLTWNLGTTYAGNYHVRSILKNEDSPAAENIVPLIIVPEIIVRSELTTDKIHYESNQDVLMDIRIGQEGRNYDIPLLLVKVSIADSLDTVLFSKEYSLENVMADSVIGISTVWNTGLSPAGVYKAKVEVFLDGEKISQDIKTFEIDAFVKIAGTIRPIPEIVFYGYPVKAAFTVANKGNALLQNLPVKVLVMDPDTQDILASDEGMVDLTLNTSSSGQFGYSTAGYALKPYKLILQYEQQGGFKTLDTALFTVKDGLAPVVTIILPEDGSVHHAPFNLTIRAIDDVSGVEKAQYRIDEEKEWRLLPPVDPATSQYGTKWVPKEAEEGPHTIWFRAFDRAGNVSEPVSTSIRIVPKVDMTMSLNAEQYGMHEDAAIKVNLLNIAWAKNVTLQMNILNNDGVVLHSFDPVQTTLAMDESREFAFTWNTGLNPAGPYKAQTVLTKGELKLTEQAVPFTILPILTFSSGLATDKTHYGLKENVALNLSVTNNGNVKAPLLNLKLKIRPEIGQDLFAKDLSVSDLGPNVPAQLAETWNTAQHAAGNYQARIEVYLNNELACFSETGFTIDPVPIITGTLEINPMKITQGENYQANYAVRNEGNVVVQNMPVKVLVVDANQANMAEQQEPMTLGINESKTGGFTFGSQGYNIGMYQAVLQAFWDSVDHDLDRKAFEIIDSAPPFEKLTGTLQATPNPVYWGQEESFQYTVRNEAGQALQALTVKILVVDPDTQETKITQSEQIDLPEKGVHTATLKAATNDLALKSYQAVLKVEMSGKEPRKLAETGFAVIAALDAAKNIADEVRLLVWVNDHCPASCRPKEHGSLKDGNADLYSETSCYTGLQKEISVSESLQSQDKLYCDPKPCKECLDLTLLKAILDQVAEHYKIVFSPCSFADELRNPLYTDILILGDSQPLPDHIATELRERIHSGTGLISSQWFKHGCSADYDEVFGITYKGVLSSSDPLIETVQSPVTIPGTFKATGKAYNIKADPDTLIAGWIKTNSKWQLWETRDTIMCPDPQGPYAAMVLHDYGQGRAIYQAFDLGRSLKETNKEWVQTLLDNSLKYVHKAHAGNVFTPYELAPIRMALKSMGAGLTARINESFPKELSLYDLISKQWIDESPWVFDTSLDADGEKEIPFYYLTPDKAGMFKTQTDINILLNGEPIPVKQLSLDLAVTEDLDLILDETINNLKALSLPPHDQARVKNALAALNKVKAKIVHTRTDVDGIIKELLKAIDYLRSVKSADMNKYRLELDRLMRSYAGLYYLFVPPGEYLQGSLEATPNPVKTNQEVNFHVMVTNDGNEAFRDLILKVVIMNRNTGQVIKTLEKTLVLEGNSSQELDIKTVLKYFKTKTYKVLLKAYSGLLLKPKLLAEEDLTVLAQ